MCNAFGFLSRSMCDRSIGIGIGPSPANIRIPNVGMRGCRAWNSSRVKEVDETRLVSPSPVATLLPSLLLSPDRRSTATTRSTPSRHSRSDHRFGERGTGASLRPAPYRVHQLRQRSDQAGECRYQECSGLWVHRLLRRWAPLGAWYGRIRRMFQPGWNRPRLACPSGVMLHVRKQTPCRLGASGYEPSIQRRHEPNGGRVNL
jgi:hypothetical protein